MELIKPIVITVDKENNMTVIKYTFSVNNRVNNDLIKASLQYVTKRKFARQVYTNRGIINSIGNSDELTDDFWNSSQDMVYFNNLVRYYKLVKNNKVKYGWSLRAKTKQGTHKQKFLFRIGDHGKHLHTGDLNLKFITGDLYVKVVDRWELAIDEQNGKELNCFIY